MTGHFDTTYGVLMGDLVRSERAPAPEALHDAFNRAVAQENRRHADVIVSPLTITLGDEFQGLVATQEDEQALIAALEEAFDYRGDVSLTLTDGEQVTGYIFDRRKNTTLADSVVRLLTPDSDEYVIISYDRVEKIEFTGKDMAHGKTFERWVERFIEKKLAGEKASIEGEGGA